MVTVCAKIGVPARATPNSAVASILARDLMDPPKVVEWNSAQSRI
jgi:hypothetical protein